MRLQAVLLATVLLGGIAAGYGQEKKTIQPVPQTFAIETFVRRAYNYLDKMVDKDGLPYFNIFRNDPAEAAHDWPDFGDVTSRQLQAAIMARRLTGQEAQNEKRWTEEDTFVSRSQDGVADAAEDLRFRSRWPTWATRRSTLYALVTAYADKQDPALRAAIDKMVEHLPQL